MHRRRFLHSGLAVSVTTGLLASPHDVAVGQVAQKTPDPAGPEPGGRYKKPTADNRLRDGALVRGNRNILACWLSDPVTRYRHFVLGSQHEAGALVVSTADQRVHRLALAADSVFEDRTPRIADVDGDGRDEIVIVKSYLKTGSSLAIAAVLPEKGLQIVGETSPIGEPFRWLNPAGIADFDGDGKPEIALVRMPHILGRLELWTYRNGQLDQILELPDASNHVAGSRFQKLYAVADFDGDGVVELAIPTLDRRSIRFLSFKGRRARELERVTLPAPAAEDFEVVMRNGRPAVSVGLNAGRTHVVEL